MNRCRLRPIIAIPLICLALSSTVLFAVETYTYDASGRLTSVTYDDGSRITYTYDNNGNILQQQAIASTNTPPGNFDLVFPANGAAGVPLSLELIWKRADDADGDTINYQVTLCTDAQLVGCTPAPVAMNRNALVYSAGVGAPQRSIIGPCEESDS